jgi:hypothetical protein
VWKTCGTTAGASSEPCRRWCTCRRRKAALEAVIRKKAQDVITLLSGNDAFQMEREKARKLKANLTSV